MDAELFDESGRVRLFKLIGPTGSMQIAITYADRSSGKREYQVDQINTGEGWTKKCPDMPNILQTYIGESYSGSRVKWLETIYQSINVSAHNQIEDQPVWINIDIPIKGCTLHTNLHCNYVENKKESLYKGIETLRRDGGWLMFENPKEAYRFCHDQYPNYKLVDHC